MQAVFTLLVLLVLPCVLQGRPIQMARSWTLISNFSTCSNTCNGGFRVRSVRCLDEDRVIVHDCGRRPDSYEFCNQVDCTTGDYNISLLPKAGIYLFELGVANAVLNFTVSNPDSYRVHLVMTESDQTQTMLKDTVTNYQTISYFRIHGAMDSLELAETNEGTVLKANSKTIMAVSNIGDIHFSGVDFFQYRNSTVYDNHGMPLLRDIPVLFLCDGYRVYKFNGSMNNPIHGSGVLFFNRDTRVAVHFVTSKSTPLFTVIITRLEDSIHDDSSPVHPSPMPLSSGDESLRSLSSGDESPAPPSSGDDSMVSLFSGDESLSLKEDKRSATSPAISSGDYGILPEEEETSHSQQHNQEDHFRDESEEHSSRDKREEHRSMDEEESSEEQRSHDTGSAMYIRSAGDPSPTSRNSNSFMDGSGTNIPRFQRAAGSSTVASNESFSPAGGGSGMFIRSADDPPPASGDYWSKETATTDTLTQEMQQESENT